MKKLHEKRALALAITAIVCVFCGLSACKQKDPNNARIEERKAYYVDLLSFEVGLKTLVEYGGPGTLESLWRIGNLCELEEFMRHPACSGTYALGAAKIIKTKAGNFVLIVPIPFFGGSLMEMKKIKDGIEEEELREISAGCCFTETISEKSF